MQRFLLATLLASTLALAAAPATQPVATTMPVTATKSSFPLTRAADILTTALNTARSTTLPEAQRRAALSAAVTDLDKLLPDFNAVALLRSTLAEEQDLPALIDVFSVVESDLRFRPTVEAPVSPGWPDYTPVGEIELKTYPAYRAAFTSKKLIFFAESRTFFTLFNHIKNANIPMTAPVEMPMTPTPSGTLVPAGMGFVYPSAQTGTPGPTADPDVTVVDVPEATVVGTAYRGKSTASRTAQAYKTLETWLEQHAANYQVAGEARVLGWNSPSMPDAKSYTEVQIPIRKRR